MWVEHLQGFEIGREGERMQGLRCRVYLERVEHLQGLKRDDLTLKIVRADRTQHMQGRLYIGAIITMVQYKQG